MHTSPRHTPICILKSIHLSLVDFVPIAVFDLAEGRLPRHLLECFLTIVAARRDDSNREIKECPLETSRATLIASESQHRIFLHKVSDAGTSAILGLTKSPCRKFYISSPTCKVLFRRPKGTRACSGLDWRWCTDTATPFPSALRSRPRHRAEQKILHNRNDISRMYFHLSTWKARSITSFVRKK